MQINGFPVERKKLEELTKAPYNPRKISPEMASALKRSLQEFGNVEPIIWNKQTGHIVGGHQRFDALLSIGETETDVVIVDMPEEREQALNIALNKISGDWNFGTLSDVLLSLHNDMRELTGFTEDEIAALLPKQEGLTDPDAIPEVVEPVARLGDIWQLGEHRLMCGDSTDAGSVALLMNGEIAFMCVTSPPYWIGKEYENEKGIEEIKSFIERVAQNISSFVVENGRLCINTGIISNSKVTGQLDCRLVLDWWQEAFRKKEWLTRNIRIWVKPGGLAGVGPHNDQVDMHWEFLCTFWKKSKTYRGQNKIGKHWAMQGYWDDVSGERQTIHSAPYPVEIPSRFIELYSHKDEIIIEPFCGSGTTIIACEQLNRKCYCMELDPHYCDVIIKRWEDFTGKKAVKIA